MTETEDKLEQWYVYIIECSDASFYTGVTKDIEKRFAQHLNKKGAKYFYGRAPVRVVYQESYVSRSEAQSREYAIKKLRLKQKIKLIRSHQTTI